MNDHPQILIVEDEPIVAADLKVRLELLGCQVVGSVPSGEKAVALAGQWRPHLVLMDIRLEGRMDGIEAAQEIRRQWRLPVVYLTAYADDLPSCQLGRLAIGAAIPGRGARQNAGRGPECL